MEGTEPPRLFGTDGIRMVVGPDLTPDLVLDVAAAVAQFLDGQGPVLIGQDFRTTSPGIARILAGTLSMYGVAVVELGPMPTPCLQFNVRALGARLSLMVTASHNPTEFNGIKFTGPDGTELTRQEEMRIERLIADRRFPPVDWQRARKPAEDSQGVRRYADSILAHSDRPAIARKRPKVILDPGNGTSAIVSPELLRELGCRVSTLHAQPDGFFPGRPSDPTETNLGDLRNAVQHSGADLGIAHDGDSDRVAFVDEQGRFVPGEVTLALFAQYVLREHPGSTIVTSVTSSSCVKDVVEAAQGRLVITRSGSLPVALGILEHSAKFGGEENGGYYWPEHQVTRDGPMSSAKMVEILARTEEPLSHLVDALPRYTVLKLNVPLAKEFRSATVREVTRTLASEGAETMTLDGVKAFFADGWILVRPSGTEPVCRVFAESRDPARARELLDLGRRLVENATPTGSGR
ncbi:MAG: phosphoglucosamine mutase [Thermoplasmata archaeon]